MIKTLITYILLFSGFLVPTQTFAEWRLVDIQPNGDKYFYDSENIKKSDDLVYFWRLVSLGQPQDNIPKSGAVYRQTDCSIGRLKNIYIVGYSGPDGTGEILIREELEEGWEYPHPGSVDDRLLKLLCE